MQIEEVQDALEEEVGSQIGGGLWEQTGGLLVEGTGVLAEGGLQPKVELDFERQFGVQAEVQIAV